MADNVPFHLVPGTSSTNAQVIKAAPGIVTGWKLRNRGTVDQCIKIHNVATTPVPGTTPVAWSFDLPAGGGANVSGESLLFSAGIAISTTKGLADSDATACDANTLEINIAYK